MVVPRVATPPLGVRHPGARRHPCVSSPHPDRIALRPSADSGIMASCRTPLHPLVPRLRSTRRERSAASQKTYYETSLDSGLHREGVHTSYPTPAEHMGGVSEGPAPSNWEGIEGDATPCGRRAPGGVSPWDQWMRVAYSRTSLTRRCGGRTIEECDVFEPCLDAWVPWHAFLGPAGPAARCSGSRRTRHMLPRANTVPG